jgi:hypothetical protein
MTIRFLNRGFFQRIFGLPATSKPLDPQCWSFSGGKILIDLNRATELKKPGGALRLEGGGLPMRVLVIRGDDGKKIFGPPTGAIKTFKVGVESDRLTVFWG